ncbi:MAG: hypothetical protein M1835_006018 [Candelina submexicana]|nr:MAG: hypothetical protein M1835_006018 [Candelina submexicana]
MSADEETKLLHARAKIAMKWQVHSDLKLFRRHTESQQASPLKRERMVIRERDLSNDGDAPSAQTKRQSYCMPRQSGRTKYRIRLSLRALKRGKEYQQASKLQRIRMEIRERVATIRKRILEGKHASVEFGTVESAESRGRWLHVMYHSWPTGITKTERETPRSINHGHATKRVVIPAEKERTQADNASDKAHKSEDLTTLPRSASSSSFTTMQSADGQRLERERIEATQEEYGAC